MGRTGNILFVCILALALCLRLWHLSHESLWLDEGWSVKIASQDLKDIVANATNDVHPPLYYTLLHFWMMPFGRSEFAIRSLSVVFGMLSVLFIYLMAGRLYDRQTALAAAFLLAVSTFHIHYSQEARMYALFAFLIIASFYWFLRRLDKPSLVYDTAWYACSLLMLYTQIYSLFILLFQNLWIITIQLFTRRYSRNMLIRWFLLQLLLGLAYLPWAIQLYHYMRMVQNNFWIKPPSFSAVRKTFEDFSGSRLLLLFFALLALRAVLDLYREKDGEQGRTCIPSPLQKILPVRLPAPEPAFFLGGWLCFPIVLPFLLSLVTQPIYVTKSVIGASLALLILVGHGYRKLTIPWLKLGVSALLIGAIGWDLWGYYTVTQKDQWREAARFLESKAQPGDLVLHDPPHVWNSTIFLCYSRRTDLIQQPYPVQGRIGRVDLIPEEPEMLLSAIEGHERVWTVHYKPYDTSRIIDIFQPQYDLIEHETFFPKIEVLLFQRKRSGEGVPEGD